MKSFRSFLHVGAIASALALVGVVSSVPVSTPAKAQLSTIDQTTRTAPPRQFSEQVIHTIRGTITFNMCRQTSNACTVKLQAAIPYNAVVLRAWTIVYTAFNSTTSDVVTIGTSKTSANEIVSSSQSIASTGVTALTVASGQQAITGGGTAQSGDNGGFNVWVKWTAGTGNTATTGLGSVVLEYVTANDGSCVAVPLGGTNAGC